MELELVVSLVKVKMIQKLVGENISQNGNLPQLGVKVKNIWNHHLEKAPRSFQPKSNSQHPIKDGSTTYP